MENYEEEVEKSNKIKLKLDFERDVKCFRDLVLESIKKHNEPSVSVEIIDNDGDGNEVDVPIPDTQVLS